MEGVWTGYWATLEGCWAAHKRGLCAYPVNRWSIKQTPNDTKLDRRSTGGVPRPLGKSWYILRKFNTLSQQEAKGVRRRTSECRIAKRTTGKMLGCMRQTCMQNEMHMMTWKNATRKQMTWQRRRITGRHLAHRIRGVTRVGVGVPPLLPLTSPSLSGTPGQ